MSTSTFHILAVCTGNASRSPAVERLLTAGLGPSTTVESAGTAAVVGAPIAAEMASLLRRAGCDADGFVARQVTADMLRRADLVIALAEENLRRVVHLDPSAAGHAFTLTAFARTAAAGSGGVAGRTPTERLRHLVILARASAPRASARRGDDVPNPFGHGEAAYEQAFAQIKRATDVIIATACAGGPSPA